MPTNIDKLIIYADYCLCLIIYTIIKNQKCEMVSAIKPATHILAAAEGEGQWEVQGRRQKSACCHTQLGS